MMETSRLQRQIGFLLEVDRLKSVLRRTFIPGQDRRENSAEHSWQVALMAVILAEHANEPVDIGRVIKMLLVHDLVEIDAGDTFVYDLQANADKAQREIAAAERIFGLLPEDQTVELRALWDEFEERKTPEARLARGLDRLMPMLHNFHTQGRAWRQHHITDQQVTQTNKIINDGSTALWDYAQELIHLATENGYLLTDLKGEPQ